jgi:hypothetical protein
MEKSKVKKLRRYIAADVESSLPDVAQPKPLRDSNGKKKVVFIQQYKHVKSPKKSILKVKSDNSGKLRLKNNQLITNEFITKMQLGAVLQLYNL